MSSRILYVKGKQPSLSGSVVFGRLSAAGHEMEEGGDDDFLHKAVTNTPDVIVFDETATNPADYLKPLANRGDLAGIPIVWVGQPGASTPVPGYPVLTLPEAADQAAEQLEVFLQVLQELKQSQSVIQELSTLNAELYERHLAVEKELYTTRQLQQSLLPKFIQDDEAETVSSGLPFSSKCHFKNEHLKISGVFLPCDALGGDLYDVIPFKDGSVGVAIGDVSGHGVPASFITAIFKASIYRATLNHTDPGHILAAINDELSNIIKTDDYVTAIYCRAQPGENRLYYSGAGHPYPLLYRAESGTVERPSENGTPLGWMAGMPYPHGQVDLKVGDKVLLFTDGISEMENNQNMMFGEAALETLFSQTIWMHPQGILNAMIRHLSEFTQGQPLKDDMSMVLIEVF